MKTSLTLACALTAALSGTAAWAQGLDLSGNSSASFEVANQQKRLESPKSMYFEVKPPRSTLSDAAISSMPVPDR